MAVFAWALCVSGPGDAAAQTALIERTRLFGNPTAAHARLSPDGKWLAWTAPKGGVLNLWVAPSASPEDRRALTEVRDRPIEQYFWAPDSGALIFVADQGGDENFRLYAVDVRTGAQRTLAAFERTRAQVVAVSSDVCDRILIGLNNRDPRWHDVFSLDLKSGALTPVLRNDRFSGFVADRGLALRVATEARPDGSVDVYRIEDGAPEAAPFERIPFDDAMTTRPLSLAAGGRLYWVDSRGRDTAALVEQDLGSGSRRVIAENPRGDVGDVIVDPVLPNPRTGEAEAYLKSYLRTEWIPLATGVAEDLAHLRRALDGEISVTSRTLADDLWTVEADPAAEPPATYLYRRSSRSLEKLFGSRDALKGAQLSPMQALEIKARDGLVLPSYLTLPPGADRDGDGRPETPSPMVLLVHGGPWLRDSYGFNPYHQWLANRGYAVLSVNFRGSSGFGKRFIAAGDRQWAGAMREDLLDAVEWAKAQGVARPDKVAIMGASYGGYASLAGLTFTPETYACGVSLVGPSNLATLLDSTPPHWESLKRQLFRRVGDPTTPEGRRKLAAQSPLTRVAAIRRPLLVAQGANDPRVKQAESEQIVAAMRARGIPVTYVLFPDEGHGLARPENSIAFSAIVESFLGKCLGARVEPENGAIEASSAIVTTSGAHSPRGQNSR